MVIRNDEVCLGKTRVPKEVGAEKKVMPKRKLCRNRRENVLVLEKQRSHGCCHISSPKAVMMASMLRLEVLVDGWR